MPDSQGWSDLAANRPGAAARKHAVALKESAPVRTLLARMLGIHTDERAWRIGADGEELLAAQLARVAKRDGRWRVLHAVPVGERGADIDHVVIGPGGVYTVNAKHHPGARVWVAEDTVLVNGHYQPYVRNSRHEAKRAAVLLSAACGFPVEVLGLVVPVGAKDVTVKRPPNGAFVVPRRQVARWLSQRRQVLDERVIEAVYDIARRSTTWHR